MLYQHSSQFACDVEALFSYHENPAALDRLIPPSHRVELLQRAVSLEPGNQAKLRLQVAPLVKLDWIATHETLDRPRLFVDRQTKGPFKSWLHRHEFAALDVTTSTLTDSVDYCTRSWPAIGPLLDRYVHGQLSSMFGYRHRTTADDIQLAQRLNGHGKRIMISGASGAIGQRIIAIARVIGAEVIVLDRVDRAADIDSYHREPSPESLVKAYTPWHVQSGGIRPADWDGIDCLIHLAGASIAAKRWTASYKSLLRSSRVDSTRKLIDVLRSSKALPEAVVTASGIGIYPSYGDRWLSEDDFHADDFLGQLAFEWEQASKQIESDGVRWAAGRLSMVLDPQAGALVPMLRQFRSFAGGRIGNGKMYWSWIERDDAASAFLWLALNEQCRGAFNLTGQPLSNAEFSQTLATILHRPNLIPAPESMLRLMLGELADGLLLRSNRASNDKLRDSGFVHRFPTLNAALQHLLT
jgi:uncharacterized protein